MVKCRVLLPHSKKLLGSSSRWGFPGPLCFSFPVSVLVYLYRIIGTQVDFFPS